MKILLSFPRKRESIFWNWIPAFAGMTTLSLFLLTATHLFAADKPSISVKAQVDRAFVTVGDRVEFRVEIQHDPRVDILSPITAERLKNFEIKETRDIPPRKENSDVVEGKIFILTGYFLGDYVIDPIVIRYKDLDGKEKEIKTNKLYISVESVEKTGKVKRDIRDIKSVVPVASQVWKIFLWSLGGLLLLGTAALAWFLIKRKDLLQRFFAPPLKPHEEAFQALLRLQDSGLLAQGNVREYYFRMSETLKRYFERRFGFKALEETSTEILAEFQRIELIPEQFKMIHQFLEAADLVKFAKFQPEPLEIQKDFKLAWSIVAVTKLIEEMNEITNNQAPITK